MVGRKSLIWTGSRIPGGTKVGRRWFKVGTGESKDQGNSDCDQNPENPLVTHTETLETSRVYLTERHRVTNSKDAMCYNYDHNEVLQRISCKPPS